MEAPTPSDAVLSVERAPSTDVDAVRELLLSLHGEGHHVMREDLPEADGVEGRAGPTELFVARLDGRLVGCAALHLSGGVPEMIELSAEAALRAFAIAPDARGRGAGELLLRRCMDRARAAGKRRLLTVADRRSTLTQLFFERMGFERRPERDWSPVPGVDLLVYSLTL